MIFVGVSGLPFERLIKKMDEIASKTREKVVMQIGKTEYIPKNSEYYVSVPPEEYENLIKNSRLFITHGGAGSIITGLKFKKRIIAIPRYKKYNEHVNDHQIDLVKFLEDKGVITAVYDIEDLPGSIKSMGKKKLYSGEKKRLVSFLKNYLEKINNGVEYRNNDSK